MKGCYLGQETVARIDALGHVNKLLKGLVIESGPSPAAGTALQADGKTVGTITSAAPWEDGRTVALGYVRVAHARPGTALRLAGEGEERVARVVDLPIDLEAEGL